VQAVAKGYLPCIGPASTQVRPGIAATYLPDHAARGQLRHRVVPHGVATFHFATLLAIAVAAYLWLGLASAVAVVVLAVTYSPLAFYGTLPDGTLAGFTAGAADCGIWRRS
jgi:hypothetical protein